jgi:hypothetical protein
MFFSHHNSTGRAAETGTSRSPTMCRIVRKSNAVGSDLRVGRRRTWQYLITNLKAMGEMSSVMSDGRIGVGMGIVLLAIVILACETLGGLRSVAWTDVLQGLLLLGGCLVNFATFNSPPIIGRSHGWRRFLSRPYLQPSCPLPTARVLRSAGVDVHHRGLASTERDAPCFTSASGRVGSRMISTPSGSR